MEVSDAYSEVSNIEIVLEDSDNDEVESYEKDDCNSSECTFFPDVADELNHGEEYTLEIDVTDEVDNTRNEDVGFVYDNRFEGDSDPEVSPRPQVFDGKGPERFSVSLDEKDESEVRVKCSPDSWFDGFSDFEEIDDSEDFTCEHQPVGFDISYDMEIILEDEAGNSETVEIGEYFFDQTSPKIGNLSAVVGVFNSDFQLSYDAYDSK
ncbi:MAG: hypothetical protein BRC30_02970, partial [Nanohaloarchaea archaeon SW_7_46_7]